jgi:hypothetical protein
VTLGTSFVQDTEFCVMVKLFRVIEMCIKKPCGELCAGLHLSDAFAVYIHLQQQVLFNLKMAIDSRFLPIEPVAI